MKISEHSHRFAPTLDALVTVLNMLDEAPLVADDQVPLFDGAGGMVLYAINHNSVHVHPTRMVMLLEVLYTARLEYFAVRGHVAAFKV